jgi:hypothetical protein
MPGAILSTRAVISSALVQWMARLGFEILTFQMKTITDDFRFPYRFSLLLCDVTQRSLIVGYRHCETPYQPNLQWSNRTKPLKMRPTGCPKTSLTKYHSTVRNIPEDRKPQNTIFVVWSIFLGTSETHKRTQRTETVDSNP